MVSLASKFRRFRCFPFLNLCFILSSFYFLFRSLGISMVNVQQHSSATHLPFISDDQKPRACIVILVRNSELEALKKTLGIFESRFNSKYRYPYVLLNDDPFTDEFQRQIIELLPTNKTNVHFGLVPREHWSYPEWISPEKAAETREQMKNIMYGWSESYRFMCRYESGFFFRHPLLEPYDYYWRVEPGTELICDVPYDPFAFMKQNSIKYGFTIAIGELPETVETLYKTTLDFVYQKRSSNSSFNPTLLNYFESNTIFFDLAAEDTRLFNYFQLNNRNEFNLRHFWSNFEIGDLNFLRSKEYLEYFDYLDRAGGFFYERWGDAPVHSLAVGMFLRKEEVQFFEDIGYYHDPLRNCPPEPYFSERRCECDVVAGAEFREESFANVWKSYTPAPYFSPHWLPWQ
jgi:alpha 1,2-mannosyltransferase